METLRDRQLLRISDSEYYDDVLVKVPEYNHPLQFDVGLLGVNTDDTLISGAGVQRSWTAKNPKSQRSVGVDIHMPPSLLGIFFPTAGGEIPSQFSLLAKGDDWQTMLQPKKTTAVHSVAQQIINCPYQGIAKRMYLQVRVLELIRLQLTPMLVDQGGVQRPPRLKAETIARIHHAKEILHSRIENPPSLLELSQLVGMSDRTLRRGFQELFGTTVFSYITNQRMEWAEELLRQGDLCVAEVANLVGYSNLGHFNSPAIYGRMPQFFTSAIGSGPPLMLEIYSMWIILKLVDSGDKFFLVRRLRCRGRFRGSFKYHSRHC